MTNFSRKKYLLSAELDRRGGNWRFTWGYALALSYHVQFSNIIRSLGLATPLCPSSDNRSGAMFRGMETHALVEASLALLR